ncbi:toxic anion resistance protein [Acrocarpospora macrocephala]|uniref:Toxic anion resistance protein n=1 Tax=Acrocarpospora macrocephala TaxID=150177 RepID=A0A5M3WKS2_9ACTN|nr:toxic anion resistance protein [Acrocarpospora macrocephala]GES08622.1 toxic anion resistance protein [Acrocarpospora macrocephala]
MDLVLTPPDPVPPVPAEKAASMLPIPADRAAELAERARGFAAELAAMDPRAPEFTRKVAGITAMGDTEIRSSAQVANRMLKRPVASASGPVPGQLVALRRTIVDLDPRQATGARKFLGLIPAGLRDYFAKFHSAQKHLDDIVRALKSGQDELLKDNAAIEGERRVLWESMLKLQEYATLAAALDAELENHLLTADEEHAVALRSDALFGVRQKHQDLLTQLAVSAQGYLALDLVRKNNLELIKGVDRATTTTIAALRTAVTVAQALAGQKLVLDQISALNQTTSDLIVATSELLRTQAAEIQTQSASTTVNLDSLRRAFDNIYATIDMIDTFRAQATENMATTVSSLTVELEHAQTYLARSAE